VARGDEVDVDGAAAGGFVEEAKGNLAGGGGFALVFEGELLEVAVCVGDEDRVLAGSGQGRLCQRECLPGSGGSGGGTGASGSTIGYFASTSGGNSVFAIFAAPLEYLIVSESSD